MFTVKCKKCGQKYYINGLTKEQWEELKNRNPEPCDGCGEEL